MIDTADIRTALVAWLTKSGLVKRIMLFNVADVGKGLEALRDTPHSLAIVVPSRDSLRHEMAAEDFNIPARAELRSEVEMLITSHDPRHGMDGATDCVALKDSLLDALLWLDLGIPGLLCLPLESEPMVIEDEAKNRGREAWKITLEFRQQLTP
jgi:hypothetical protein